MWLTRTDGARVWVRASEVVAVLPETDGSTRVRFRGVDPSFVSESPDEVVDLIAAETGEVEATLEGVRATARGDMKGAEAASALAREIRRAFSKKRGGPA